MRMGIGGGEIDSCVSRVGMGMEGLGSIYLCNHILELVLHYGTLHCTPTRGDEYIGLSYLYRPIKGLKHVCK